MIIQANTNYVARHLDDEDATNIILQEGAQCTLYLYDNSLENLNLVVECAQHARFVLYFFSKTSLSVSLTFKLYGAGASVLVRGGYALREQNKSLITTRQEHYAPSATSDVLIKGIVHDQAYASYHGTIHVTQEAYGTTAQQYNKHLLLSSEAQAISIPSLEVLTDDVQCKHGSAVGFVDAEQLFYMMNRGLTKEDAISLWSTSFLKEVMQEESI